MKEQFDEIVGEYTVSEIQKFIDNAPTVEYPFYAEAYQTGYEEAKKDFERQTGEWIDTGDMEEYWAEEYQCSICGAKDHWHNFCPNCGAKMKEEEE